MGDMGSEKSSGGAGSSGGNCSFIPTGPGTFDHAFWGDIDGFSREKKDSPKICGYGKNPDSPELVSAETTGEVPSFPEPWRTI